MEPHFSFLDPLRKESIPSARSRETGKLVSISSDAQHTYVLGVSGSGKTRYLLRAILRDISRGLPVVVLDPMGDVYPSVLSWLGSALDLAQGAGVRWRELSERYRFLDLRDDENPIRFNPLEAIPHETAEEAVEDLMSALERLFDSSLETQRQLRVILRGIFWIIASLNRLPVARRPQLVGRTLSYPLTVRFASEFLQLSSAEQAILTGAVLGGDRSSFHGLYFEHFRELPALERHRLVNSSWNALQYLLSDSLVLRFLDTKHSSFHPSDLFRSGTSLIAHLPLHQTLAGARVVGKLLLSKIHRAAFRRPERDWKKPCIVYLDEFHQFGSDSGFSDSLSNIRKTGVRYFLSHQNASQPPFHDASGEALLRTIRANCQTRIIFRLGRADAESIAQEIFPLSQRKENFSFVEESSGESFQRGTTTGSSHGTSSGSARSESESFFESRLRETSGESHQYGSSSTSSRSESETRGGSSSRTTKRVFYSLEGERELFVERLQSLPNRQFVYSGSPLLSEVLETLEMPERVSLPGALPKLSQELLLWQKARARVALARSASQPMGALPAPAPQGLAVPAVPMDWMEALITAPAPPAKVISGAFDRSTDSVQNLPSFLPVVADDSPFVD